jgi:hypothetical protein
MIDWVYGRYIMIYLYLLWQITIFQFGEINDSDWAIFYTKKTDGFYSPKPHHLGGTIPVIHGIIQDATH